MDGYNNLMQLQNMGQSHIAPPMGGYGGYGMIPSNGSPIMGGATHGGFPSPVGMPGQPVGPQPIGIRPQPFPIGGYGGGFGGTVQPQPMPHPPRFGGFGGSVQPQPWGGGFNPSGGFGGSVQPQPWGGGMAGGGLYGGPEPSPFGGQGNLNNLMMLQQMGRF